MAWIMGERLNYGLSHAWFEPMIWANDLSWADDLTYDLNFGMSSDLNL